MIQVFLSHSSKDKPQVRALARLLEKEKDIEPWLDEWNLVPGDTWQEGIEEALETCQVCLCLIGRDEFGPWHHEEIRTAIARRVEDRDQNFRVIPVLLPGGRRGERSKLPSFLTRSTWVEFRESFEEEENYHRLICGIRGIAPGSGPNGKPIWLTMPAPSLDSGFSMLIRPGYFLDGKQMWNGF